jgi:hypothetical protein
LIEPNWHVLTYLHPKYALQYTSGVPLRTTKFIHHWKNMLGFEWVMKKKGRKSRYLGVQQRGTSSQVQKAISVYCPCATHGRQTLVLGDAEYPIAPWSSVRGVNWFSCPKALCCSSYLFYRRASDSAMCVVLHRHWFIFC